ncbi:hypothetical protein PZA11_005298 [Diplocarpon coronariae]
MLSPKEVLFVRCEACHYHPNRTLFPISGIFPLIKRETCRKIFLSLLSFVIISNQLITLCSIRMTVG